MIKTDLADHRTGTRHKVDDAIGHPGLFENLHKEVRRIDAGRSRLKQNRVTHNGRRCCQVACDSGEIEWSYGKDKAFERTLLHEVPETFRGIHGLVGINLLRVVHIEAQKVDQLAGCINLCLVGALAGGKHADGIHDVTILTGKQLGSFEKDRGALFPTQVGPIFLGGHGSINRHVDLFFTGQVVITENMLMVMRHDNLAHFTGTNFFTTDNQGNLNFLVGDFFNRRLEQIALRSSGSIAVDRLIDRGRDLKDGIVQEVHDGHLSRKSFYVKKSFIRRSQDRSQSVPNHSDIELRASKMPSRSFQSED